MRNPAGAWTAAEWEDLRRAARAYVERERSVTHAGLRLTSIDEAGLAQARAWSGRRYPTWNWDQIARNWARSRFEAAIWIEDRLCGLAIGEAGPAFVEVARLEADPDPGHPLKGGVIDLALASAEILALGIGAPETRIRSPIPALIQRYAARGYRIAGQIGYEVDYLVRTVPRQRS